MGLNATLKDSITLSYLPLFPFPFFFFSFFFSLEGISNQILNVVYDVRQTTTGADA